jgi:hypothetical protein
LLRSVFRSWRGASRAIANGDPRRRLRRQAIRVYLRWPDEWTNELADYWFSDYMLEYFFEHWYLEMAVARAFHSQRRRYGRTAQCPRGKGILVPHGTVIMLEQIALLNDVDSVWFVGRSIYATIESRLACSRASSDGRCGIPSAI